MTLADQDDDSTVVDAVAGVEVNVGDIAHICHDRHDWQWCTFFQASVLFCKENTIFWPILATFGPFGLFHTFFGFL